MDRWTELRATAFATSNLLARVNAMAALLQEAQTRNFERWPILSRRIWPNTFLGQTYEDEINYLKEFTRHRLAWIEKQFLRPPGIESSAGKFTLTAAGGKILFTVDGSDPRFVFRQAEPSREDTEEEEDSQRVIGNERTQRKTANEGERQEGQHRFRSAPRLECDCAGN